MLWCWNWELNGLKASVSHSTQGRNETLRTWRAIRRCYSKLCSQLGRYETQSLACHGHKLHTFRPASRDVSIRFPWPLCTAIWFDCEYVFILRHTCISTKSESRQLSLLCGLQRSGSSMAGASLKVRQAVPCLWNDLGPNGSDDANCSNWGYGSGCLEHPRTREQWDGKQRVMQRENERKWQSTAFQNLPCWCWLIVGPEACVRVSPPQLVKSKCIWDVTATCGACGASQCQRSTTEDTVSNSFRVLKTIRQSSEAKQWQLNTTHILHPAPSTPSVPTV